MVTLQIFSHRKWTGFSLCSFQGPQGTHRRKVCPLGCSPVSEGGCEYPYGSCNMTQLLKKSRILAEPHTSRLATWDHADCPVNQHSNYKGKLFCAWNENCSQAPPVVRLAESVLHLQLNICRVDVLRPVLEHCLATGFFWLTSFRLKFLASYSTSNA